MKGIVFNLLESFVSEKFDDQTWDDIFVRSNLNTTDPFVGPKTYDDEDLFSLVTTATKQLNVITNDLLKVFGEYCFPKLIEKQPKFLDGKKTPMEFLKSVDGIIHVEVQKLMPEAYLPKIEVTEISENQLKISYSSKRKLCGFLEGLVTGCSNHFDYTVEMQHEVCMHDGNDECVLTANFSKNTE